MKPKAVRGAAPTSLSALFIPLGMCICCLPLGVLAESLDNLRAIVRIEHTRSFDDVANLSFTINTAPPAAVALAKESSPSKLIASVYGFGLKDSPEAYAVMQERILKLNNASNPQSLKAGTVFVPDLPILTSKRVESRHTAAPFVNNNAPKIDYQALASSGFRSAYFNTIKIGDQLSKSLNYVRVDSYPAREALKILEAARRENRNVTIGMEAGITIGASPSECPDTSVQVLSPEERSAVLAALTGATDQTERYLFILDTGWPTVGDQSRSLQNMRRILDLVRAKMLLPATAVPRFNPAVSATSFVPITNIHACMISRSLQEFKDLDSGERIKVIYLPLRPGQFSANVFFREVITLDYLLDALGDRLFASGPSETEVKEALTYAQKALDTLPAFRDSWKAGDDVVRIYEPLVSGILKLLTVYARTSPSLPAGMKVDARFWVSMSWFFSKFSAPPSLPTTKSYMVFAAAGNDKQDFVAGDRLFASEAANGNRVFAVMNSDEKHGTLACNSASFPKIWDATYVNWNIGAFPGRLVVATTHECPGPGGGTSFSTPRLAWLAAASDISSRVEDLNWQSALSARLLKSRDKVVGDPAAAPVRVKKLFSTQ